MPDTLAAAAGPGALAVLVLYLLSHVAHLARLRSEAPGAFVKSGRLFPWAGLYPNPLGGLLTWLSIGAMPTAACGAIVCRPGAPSSWSAGVGMIATAVVVALGFETCRRIGRLREGLRSRGGPAESS